MIRGLFILLFSCFFLLTGAQEVKKQSVPLIPYPVNLIEGEGQFVFTEKTIVAWEDEEMEVLVEDFVSLFTEAAGFTPKLKKGKKGDVRIMKDENLQEEGYVLEVHRIRFG